MVEHDYYRTAVGEKWTGWENVQWVNMDQPDQIITGDTKAPAPKAEEDVAAEGKREKSPAAAAKGQKDAGKKQEKVKRR